MVTETKTTEQETTPAEQTLGQLLETAGAEEPVAIGEKEPVAEEGKPEAKAPKTYTEEEFRAGVLSEANSIAARSLKPFQQANETLTKQVSDLKATINKSQRDAERARREGAEREQWENDGIPLPAIENIQRTEASRQEFYDEISAAYKVENAKWQQTRNENIDHRLFYQYDLPVFLKENPAPSGEEILQRFATFSKELGEGNETDKELKILRNSSKAKEPPKKAPKLDSGRLSAPGGKDFKSASPGEKVAEQMRRDRNKK